MNRLCRFAAFVITTMALTAAARADIVTEWNVMTLEFTQAAQASGNAQARTLAMVHVAMADAVNSVKGKYARYITSVPMAPSASAEAAAASAARNVLSDLFPSQKARIDESFNTSIARIPDGDGKAQGITLGEKVAAAVIADRANDGTAAPDTYRPITTPGAWIPTTPPIQEQYARAKPWVLKSADQFRPGPPPALTSAIYARDYNETKSLGGTKSANRTAEQTALVRFWPTPSLSLGWQSAARQLVAAKELPLEDCARLFALMNMASVNSYIVDWDAKFTYNFWRPLTAIRNGDQDGNDATERDPSWTPFAPTPVHPEYPSQAAISAGVALAVIESVFGSNPSIEVKIADTSDATRIRTLTVTQIADEHANIRVWGGIHFRNSLDVASDMGRRMASYMVANVMTPIR